MCFCFGILYLMNKVAVIGTSGSGKSTVARQIATKLDVPYFDLDKVILIYNSGRLEKPATEIYRDKVEYIVRNNNSWVIEGVYPKVADIVWTKADKVIWLDLPFQEIRQRYDQREAIGKTKGPFQEIEIHKKEHERLQKEYERIIDELRIDNVIHVTDASQDVVSYF